MIDGKTIITGGLDLSGAVHITANEGFHIDISNLASSLYSYYR